MSSAEESITQTAIAAHEFVQLYYALFQSRVDELLKMYHQQAVSNWNGNFFSGIAQIRNHLISLTPGKYDIETYDSQPIGDLAQGGSLLFIVTGRVKYNNNENNSREFYHQFILSRSSENVWFIVSENFRLLR
ncbi:nuclear transport factor 2 family export factor 2, putative [Entamoeba histolytica HM-1:IMSS-B]|uniref:NTF2-related export protein n=4 Tax=Entamoeba histolytica TaxID=5759 RepID=C4LTA7_ENTH1|nr:nuclear transport factor 2-like export factor 2, putative [Entamoeba histolytica HM-1:IMSS]EAL51817.1 nuclear transport factor 2-like export factor 2, putative [Entamoeba histolytica HM-1:IMSS]EMH73430.1 nuclear transport factor 2 family export factor 2, putative [Entamoeba histolytica HM-1:IMSS-B]ENY61885.1 nuclear transport factor 2 family export factor 2, putative [Entamoeba histolytica HM-1:IMSS-A]GAT91785.1 nuclear transport factor 2-like export factor 2 putative [Entamoeba histolytica]|eukprot:XP_657208.1 nuclear transport factor 2-like export factor 2, putative [Entamoeba histolytica HM-1:IMSS]